MTFIRPLRLSLIRPTSRRLLFPGPANGPAVWVPTGSLGFRDFQQDRAYKGGVLPSSISGMTVTRASAGYDLDVTMSFAADQPRRTDAGLLIETAGSNRFLRSTDLGASSWGKSNTVIGATQADNLQLVTEGVGASEVFQTVSGVPAGQWLMFSAIVRRGNHDWCRLRIDEGGGGEFSNCWFNLANGSIGSVALSGGNWNSGPGIIKLSGARFLLYGAYRPNGSTTTRRVRISSAAADGTSASVDNAQRYQGFHQLEAPSSIPTSPIVTAGSSASRAADAITDTVPAGATRCTLTYSDGSTATLSGLTPSGTVQLPANPLRTTLLTMDYRP